MGHQKKQDKRNLSQGYHLFSQWGALPCCWSSAFWSFQNYFLLFAGSTTYRVLTVCVTAYNSKRSLWVSLCRSRVDQSASSIHK